MTLRLIVDAARIERLQRIRDRCPTNGFEPEPAHVRANIDLCDALAEYVKRYGQDWRYVLRDNADRAAVVGTVLERSGFAVPEPAANTPQHQPEFPFEV